MTAERDIADVDRRLAWWTAGSAGAGLVVLLLWLVPWGQGEGLTPASAADYFSADQLRAAESYAGAVRALGWASYALSLVLALGLGFTRAGPWLVDRLPQRRRWLTLLAAVLVLLLLGRLATLPLALAAREERLAVGLTDQSLGDWFLDRGRGLLVSWVLVSLVLLVVMALARRSPRRWFAWAGGALVVLVFAGSYLYPVAVEPVFNDFEPLPAGELRSSVLALAEEEQVRIGEVLVADASRRTTTLNAYVSGLGETRRVVLYDNLLEQPQDQILAVVAHELAHVRHRDVLVGTTLGAVAGVLGISLGALVVSSSELRRRLGLHGPADARAVPLFLALFAVSGLLASPVENAASRAIELRADRTALAVTRDAAAFAEMQRQLALRSLADPTPPRWSHLWFASHPTVLERLALAEEVEDE